MDPIIGAAAIGAGANLLGGIGSFFSGNSAQEREYKRQKEFAQNGIQWKVADAKKAGLHPLYAIGAQGASYSPQSTVGTDFGLGDIGQGLTDFASRYKSPKERAHDQWYNKTTQLLQIRNQELQNDYIQQQIKESEARIAQQPGNPVSFAGTGNSRELGMPSQPLYQVKPDEVVSGAPDKPQAEAAPKRDIFYVADEKGNLSFYPGSNVSDYVSESYLDNFIWKAKALLSKPPKHLWAKDAIDYRLNPLLQRWEPVFKRPRRYLSDDEVKLLQHKLGLPQY